MGRLDELAIGVVTPSSHCRTFFGEALGSVRLYRADDYPKKMAVWLESVSKGERIRHTSKISFIYISIL
jgi:hypothetical protein